MRITSGSISETSSSSGMDWITWSTTATCRASECCGRTESSVSLTISNLGGPRMQITVQFFAQLRDLAGTSERIILLADETTVADLLAQLYREYPALEKWNDRILIGAGV